MTAAAGPNESVAEDDILCRRVRNQPSFLPTDPLTGLIRVSSGAFQPDEDGLSVYLLSVLNSAGLDEGAVRTRPDDVIVGLRASVVRRLDLQVRRDPVLDSVPWHPRDDAHALVTGWPPGKNKALRGACADACAIL